MTLKHQIFSVFLLLAITMIIHGYPTVDKAEVAVEQKEGEKLFFPLISFTGSKPTPPPPTPAVPPSQVIVVPQNTSISVASPGQPITVYQSGPTVISSG